jgi:hypothetical protein
LGSSNVSGFYKGTTDANGRITSLLCLEKIYSGVNEADQKPIVVFGETAVHGILKWDLNLTSSSSEVLEMYLNTAPQVWVINLYDNMTIAEDMVIRGYTSSQSPIEYVEYSIDNSSWVQVDGTDFFNISFSPYNLTNGPHTFEIKAFNGMDYSDTLFFNIVVNVPPRDSDGDNLTDAQETSTYHTDPLDPDTDGDALWDGMEIDNSDGNTTDPLNPDTDADGLLDGVEDANQNGKVDPGETDPNAKDEDANGGTQTPTSTILLYILVVAIIVVILLVIAGVFYSKRPKDMEEEENDMEPSRLGMSRARMPRDRKKDADEEKEEKKGRRRGKKDDNDEEDGKRSGASKRGRRKKDENED